MEYIQNPDFEQISVLLTNHSVGSYNLNGKIEAFSSSVSDKQNEQHHPQHQHHKNPTEDNDIEPLRRQRSHSFGSFINRKYSRRRTSSLGDLSEPSSRMLFMDFINALNEAFPDYDFGYSKLHQFKELDPPVVMSQVNNYLAEVTVAHQAFLEKLWTAIDEIVNLRQCEIFSYSPDNHDDDQYANIWEFHLFFFNKQLHRLCYFTCAAQSIFRRANRWGLGLYERADEVSGSDSEAEFEAEEGDEDEDSEEEEGMDVDEDGPGVGLGRAGGKKERVHDLIDLTGEDEDENEVPDW